MSKRPSAAVRNTCSAHGVEGLVWERTEVELVDVWSGVNQSGEVRVRTCDVQMPTEGHYGLGTEDMSATTRELAAQLAGLASIGPGVVPWIIAEHASSELVLAQPVHGSVHQLRGRAGPDVLRAAVGIGRALDALARHDPPLALHASLANWAVDESGEGLLVDVGLELLHRLVRSTYAGPYSSRGHSVDAWFSCVELPESASVAARVAQRFAAAWVELRADYDAFLAPSPIAFAPLPVWGGHLPLNVRWPEDQTRVARSDQPSEWTSRVGAREAHLLQPIVAGEASLDSCARLADQLTALLPE